MSQTFIEQRQNIGRLTTLEVDQNGGDDLRMLVTDNIGGALRFHKVERLDPAGGFAGFENVLQQAGGALFAQCFNQHRAQIFIGVNAQRRELLGLLLKLGQHVGQLFIRDLLDARHGGTELLYFAGAEVLKHLSGAIFANRHQQNDAFVDSGKITHGRYSSIGE